MILTGQDGGNNRKSCVAKMQHIEHTHLTRAIIKLFCNQTANTK